MTEGDYLANEHYMTIHCTKIPTTPETPGTKFSIINLSIVQKCVVGMYRFSIFQEFQEFQDFQNFPRSRDFLRELNFLEYSRAEDN